MGIGLTNLGMFGPSQHTVTGSDESVFLHYINDISVFGSKSYIFEKANEEEFQKLITESVTVFSCDTGKTYLYDRLTNDDIDLVVRRHKKLGEVFNTRIDQEIFDHGRIDDILSTITTEKFNKLEEKFQNGVKRYISDKTTGDQVGLWLGNIFGIEPMKIKTSLVSIMNDEQFWNAYVKENESLMWLLSHSISAAQFAGSALITDDVYNTFISALVKNEDNMLHFFNKLVADGRIAQFFDSSQRCDSVINSTPAIRALIRSMGSLIAFVENATAVSKIQTNDVLKAIVLKGLKDVIAVENAIWRNIPEYENLDNELLGVESHNSLSDSIIKSKESMKEISEKMKTNKALAVKARDDAFRLLTAILNNNHLYTTLLGDTNFFTAWCENATAIKAVLLNEGGFNIIMSNEKSKELVLTNKVSSNVIYNTPALLEKVRDNEDLYMVFLSSDYIGEYMGEERSKVFIDNSKVVKKIGHARKGHTSEDADFICNNQGLDFNSILKQAIESLPEEGGIIQILEGGYMVQSNLSEIISRSNILILGDENAVIIWNTDQPIFKKNIQNITFYNLHMVLNNVIPSFVNSEFVANLRIIGCVLELHMSQTNISRSIVIFTNGYVFAKNRVRLFGTIDISSNNQQYALFFFGPGLCYKNRFQIMSYTFNTDRDSLIINISTRCLFLQNDVNIQVNSSKITWTHPNVNNFKIMSITGDQPMLIKNTINISVDISDSYGTFTSLIRADAFQDLVMVGNEIRASLITTDSNGNRRPYSRNQPTGKSVILFKLYDNNNTNRDIFYKNQILANTSNRGQSGTFNHLLFFITYEKSKMKIIKNRLLTKTINPEIYIIGANNLIISKNRLPNIQTASSEQTSGIFRYSLGDNELEESLYSFY